MAYYIQTNNLKMVETKMLFLLFVLINLSLEVKSSHFHVSTNPTSWKEAKEMCNMAKKADVCDTSGGNCQIKLTGNDVVIPDASEVWIDSYLLRSNFIYNDGCHAVNIQLLDRVAKHFKIGANNDVNECASRCGDTFGYALYEYNCFCVNQTAESNLRDVNYDNCNIRCREGSYEDCGGTPTSTDYYVTYYKVFKPSGDIQTSCIAVHWNEDYRLGLTFKNCNDKHGFACVVNSTTDAKKYCFDIGGRISHRLDINAAGIANIIPDNYYWSAYHRRYMYRWDTTLDEGVFGLQGCLALTANYETTTTSMPRTTTTITQKPTTTSTATTSTTPQPTTSTTKTSFYFDHTITFDKIMTVKTSTMKEKTTTTPEPTSSTKATTVYHSINLPKTRRQQSQQCHQRLVEFLQGPMPTENTLTYSQSELGTEEGRYLGYIVSMITVLLSVMSSYKIGKMKNIHIYLGFSLE
ncbi:hypothetical protein KUTeg_004096 [Tegillarca granosa]|uniref:WSC domain-containing protein n=1 Tax=Tegillarca granosa TaxID=220873 RepID=A0ABQ9FTH6_TEGGR|nr:hypothetical protein KUTeg_004096 [Tegillarca granosa]